MSELSKYVPRSGELFSVTKQSGPTFEASQNVIVTGGENGGVESTMPVIRTLLDRGIGVRALFADAGLTAFIARGDKHDLCPRPLDMANEEFTKEPDALVFSPSVDGSLERYASSCFEAPTVVIEDFYESSRIAIEQVYREGQELPTVCVIDEQAKRMIGRRFSDLSIPVEITGPSAFGRLAGENMRATQKHVKAELDIPNKKLVVIQLPSLGHAELAGEIADACSDMRDDVVFAARRHPSDTIDYGEIFKDMNCVDTTMYDMERISAAADIVIAQRSTCSLLAAIRQQPNIALNRFIQPGFTLPLVESGASLEAVPVELPHMIDELLEGKSERYKAHRMDMASYKVDGKEASRIADVVCRAMVSRQTLQMSSINQ